MQELAQYRSNFFGELKKTLGDRDDIQVVGDRFVFQSDIFFDSGSAELTPEGYSQLDKLAAALLDLEGKIPKELNWVLRVDGHTDIRPISTPTFRSNWELSAARAISVARYRIGKGVPPNRLAAAGFGEFQPIAPGNSETDLLAQPAHRAEAHGTIARPSRRAAKSPSPRPSSGKLALATSPEEGDRKAAG